MPHVLSWVFLFVSVVCAAFTLNALAPLRARGYAMVPSFFASWLTIELAGHHLAWEALAAALFIRFGALAFWPGWIALGLCAVSWIGLVVLVVRGARTRGAMRRVVAGVATEGTWPRLPWWRVLFVLPSLFSRLRVEKNVVFSRVAGRKLRLDVFMPRSSSPNARRPAIVQIHGGAWVFGDKGTQGLPLLTHLANQGWVGFNVNYRLSPAATFPDHLVDVKRAIAWIREHADEYGVDPDFIAITGGSAGGHLAALAALTAGDPRYQPGFEQADTHVQAAVPMYGVYDFTNRLGTMPKEFIGAVLQPMVMKAYLKEQPELFEQASPIDQVHADAPPFLVVHGDRDTLAPLADARLFVRRLEETSRAPVLYAELHGAQHAFDVFPSLRSAAAVEGVERFLNAQYRAALARRARADTEAVPADQAAALV
jgi:acetyl esterase/lipase